MGMGGWHQVVAWHDATADTLNIQVDNGAVTSVSYSNGAKDTTFALSVGGFADGTYVLNGRVDELAFYKRVLTSGERSWLYNNGLGRSYYDLSQMVSPLVNYSYNSSRPHAVTGLSNGNSYQYDANGNMTQRVVDGVTWNLTYNVDRAP